jgi:hypothetical protein
MNHTEKQPPSFAEKALNIGMRYGAMMFVTSTIFMACGSVCGLHDMGASSKPTTQP